VAAAARCRLDLAETLAATEPSRAAALIAEARVVFADLGAPRYVERADALAACLAAPRPHPAAATATRGPRPRRA
jgi:hypothetical protein